MIVWVDCGLERWADYYRDGRNNGLGFPSCSAEVRVFIGGGMNAVPDQHVPEMIALMESAVLSMDDDMREIVKVSYMSGGNRHNQAGYLSRKFKKNITRSRLTELINQAHQYIEGYSRGFDININKLLT